MAENSEKQQKKQRGRPFPKGVSGNPAGRPKGFAALIRSKTNDGEELIDLGLSIARGQLSIVAGDSDPVVPSVRERLDAIKFLGPYVGGTPVQSLEVSGEGGGPLVVQVVSYADEADD